MTKGQQLTASIFFNIYFGLAIKRYLVKGEKSDEHNDFDFNRTDAKQLIYSPTSYGSPHSTIMERNHNYSFTYEKFFFL